ncbi:MAG: adenylate/guanylate cyclase domain-containing protein [Byssovorax sp.]
MRLRSKALVLFTALSLVPTVTAVALLINVNVVAVRDTEQTLQDAILTEVASTPTRLVGDVEQDAVAVAAILGRAAAGAVKDDDAVESVRALISTRATVPAVRFEVPAAKVSTVIRRAGAAAGDAPESTPDLRAAADAAGVAFAVPSVAPNTPLRGIVVARIPSSPDAKGPVGYVVVGVDLAPLGEELRGVAERRFGGRDVSLLIATRDRRAVATYGMPSVVPGGSVADHPLWKRLFTDAPWSQRVGVVSEYPSESGTKMIGVAQTMPDLDWAVAVWRPEPVAYAALAEMRQKGALVAFAAALLALIAGALTARRVTTPILDLVTQARLIGERQWRKVTLQSPGDDEIGELTRSLGQMAEGLEKGEAEIAHEAKLRGDLGRFMSKPLVDAIVRGEHPLALGGKRSAVSVLFADIVGFTPLAESRDAQQVVGLLNELFSVLSEIVFRHGGTVDKFIGDCIMAVWGAPIPQEDHAARALAAAEDMMRFLETANEEWKEKYDVEIRLGIGVNSGEAIVGNVGSDKRMEYTVIGDVVNIAARLEAIAQPNQVLVAETTKRLAGDKFALRELGARKLTGRKAETMVYALDTE